MDAAGVADDAAARGARAAEVEACVEPAGGRGAGGRPRECGCGARAGAGARASGFGAERRGGGGGGGGGRCHPCPRRCRGPGGVVGTDVVEPRESPRCVALHTRVARAGEMMRFFFFARFRVIYSLLHGAAYAHRRCAGARRVGAVDDKAGWRMPELVSR